MNTKDINTEKPSLFSAFTNYAYDIASNFLDQTLIALIDDNEFISETDTAANVENEGKKKEVHGHLFQNNIKKKQSQFLVKKRPNKIVEENPISIEEQLGIKQEKLPPIETPTDSNLAHTTNAPYLMKQSERKQTLTDVVLIFDKHQSDQIEKSPERSKVIVSSVKNTSKQRLSRNKSKTHQEKERERKREAQEAKPSRTKYVPESTIDLSKIGISTRSTKVAGSVTLKKKQELSQTYLTINEKSPSFTTEIIIDNNNVVMPETAPLIIDTIDDKTEQNNQCDSEKAEIIAGIKNTPGNVNLVDYFFSESQEVITDIIEDILLTLEMNTNDIQTIQSEDQTPPPLPITINEDGAEQDEHDTEQDDDSAHSKYFAEKERFKDLDGTDAASAHSNCDENSVHDEDSTHSENSDENEGPEDLNTLEAASAHSNQDEHSDQDDDSDENENSSNLDETDAASAHSHHDERSKQGDESDQEDNPDKDYEYVENEDEWDTLSKEDSSS